MQVAFSYPPLQDPVFDANPEYMKGTKVIYNRVKEKGVLTVLTDMIPSPLKLAQAAVVKTNGQDPLDPVGNHKQNPTDGQICFHWQPLALLAPGWGGANFTWGLYG
jgi:hypothetical protein